MAQCPHCGSERPIGEEHFCSCRSDDQLPVKPMTTTTWLIVIPFAVLTLVIWAYFGGIGSVVAYLTLGPDEEGPGAWVLATREVKQQLEHPRQAEFPDFYRADGVTRNREISWRHEVTEGEQHYRVGASLVATDEPGYPGRHRFQFQCWITYDEDEERLTQQECEIEYVEPVALDINLQPGIVSTT